MERVSDAKVEWLIDGLILEACRIPPSIARRLKSALTELRERREQDKAAKETPNWERPLPMFGAEGAPKKP